MDELNKGLEVGADEKIANEALGRCFEVIERWSVKMEYKEETKVMGAGEVLSVERSNPHSFTGVGSALLLELSSPCVIEDNFFKERKIPIGGNYAGE